MNLTETYKRQIAEDGHVPGASIKNQLTSLVRNSEKLLSELDETKEYPQWWVNKLVKAADYVDTAADFLQNKADQSEKV